MSRCCLLALVLAIREADAAVNAPVASAVCPDGYFRNATALFPCDTHQGVAYAPVSSQEVARIRVPAGVTDLQLLVRSQSPLGVSLYDPSSGSDVTSAVINAGWKQLPWHGLNVNISAGQARSQATGVLLPGLWTAMASYSGQSPGELDMMVHGTSGEGRHLANISYSYSAFDGCSQLSVPKGCADFARYAARQLVFNWSSWAQQTYTSADAAWQGLCDNAMKGVEPLSPGPVPFYIFGDVWAPWPLANKVHPGWREAFRFMDTLGGTPPNSYVDMNEFQTAYGLASTYLSMYGWCEALRKEYKTSEDAWNALSGAQFGLNSAIDYPMWERTLWASYKPSGGFQKASADESFVYTDADGDEQVSEKEFASVFFSCAAENRGLPPGGKGSAAAEAEDAAANQIRPRAAGAPSNASASRSISTLSDASFAQPKCLYSGVEYYDQQLQVDSNSQPSQTNLSACQKQCRETAGCGHFTFYDSDGSCKLFQVDAIWRESSRSISGASRCTVKIDLRFSGADSSQLLPAQILSLQSSLAGKIASQTGVPVSDIQTSQGQIGKVSVQAESPSGALLVQVIVDVPPGQTLDSIKDPLDSTSGQAELVSELGSMNALSAGTPLSAVNVAASVNVVPASQCFMVGSQLEPNMNSQEPYAANVTLCQAQCAKTPGCHFFTFFKATSVCTLQGANAKASAYDGAVAGPQTCGVLPSQSEPQMRELVPDEQGSVFQSVWFWVLLVCIVLLAAGALLWLLKGKQIARWFGGRQLSRSKLEAKANNHRYMPLSDRHLDDNAIMQAAGPCSKGAMQRNGQMPMHSPDSTGSYQFHTPGSNGPALRLDTPHGASLNGDFGQRGIDASPMPLDPSASLALGGSLSNSASGGQWQWAPGQLPSTPSLPASGMTTGMAGGSLAGSSPTPQPWLQPSATSTLQEEESPSWMPKFLGPETTRASWDEHAKQSQSFQVPDTAHLARDAFLSGSMQMQQMQQTPQTVNMFQPPASPMDMQQGSFGGQMGSPMLGQMPPSSGYGYIQHPHVQIT